MLLSKNNAKQAEQAALLLVQGYGLTEEAKRHLLSFCVAVSRKIPQGGRLASEAVVTYRPDNRLSLREKFWWAVHNLVAHPLCEVCHWVGLQRYGNKFHDWTVPVQKVVVITRTPEPVGEVEPAHEYW